MPKPSPTVRRRSPAPARRPGAALVTVLRALASFAVLVVLMAGLPVVLWWGTAIVAPAGIQAMGNLLSTEDSGQVFLLALAVAGWAGWALFAVSVLVEIPAQLRGRTAPQLRLLIGQRTAAALVGAVLLALPTGTALAASTSPAHATPHATATARPDSRAVTDPATTPPIAHGQDGQQTFSYTVQNTRPAESLWSIAQSRLGDGSWWEEIADLNDGRTMPDGHIFHASSPIQPGWTLHLPRDARLTQAPQTSSTEGMQPQGGRSTAETKAATSYTVQTGDSLSKIAQDELGDATQYPAIFELNKGEAQPGGQHFTNPDRVYPGQHLDLPAPNAPGEDKDTDGSEQQHQDPGQHDKEQDDRSATPPASPETTPSPSQTTPPASATPSASSSKDGAEAGQPAPGTTGQPTQPAPSTTKPAPTDVPASPTSQPTNGPQASPATTPEPAHTADDNSGVTTRQVALTVGFGALLAASLTGALGVKRILQQRRRRAGETIAIDADPTRLEQTLNATAAPTGVTLLDTALRTLAHHAVAAEQELPTVRGARVTDRTLQLIVDDPSTTPLPPFTTGDVPGTWALEPTTPLLQDDAAREVTAPYPGLVTLGTTEDRSLLLANLLHTGTLLLDGTAEDVLAVCRALALEAGTSGWTDHTEIVTVGLGTRLATLLPQGRVRTMPHLASVVSDLGALLVETHQHSDNPQEAPSPLPWILICAGDIDAEHAWQLADATSAARHLPVAVILPASDTTRQAFPDAEHLNVAPDTQVTVAHLSTEPVRLQRLTDDEYRQYIHALEVADQPAQPATGAWQLAEDHDLAATAPRPGPHPVLLHQGEGSEGSDPGNPFPALLASAGSSQIRLVKPANETDSPATDAELATDEAAEPSHGTSAEPGEPVAAVSPSHDDNASSDGDDPQAPEIAVLGPLHVSGITGSGHGPKVAALASLIYLRPGRTADSLCTAMDPVSPWSTRTLQSRLSEIRSRFGTAPDGDPYLPRPKNGYQFHPDVRSDWDRFQHLAAQGLANGPAAGIRDLENALGLVRGKPFDGRDYPWADAVQQQMISRIVDVAHTLATWHATSDTPDLDAARHAAQRGLDIDETAEVLHRDGP